MCITLIDEIRLQLALRILKFTKLQCFYVIIMLGKKFSNQNSQAHNNSPWEILVSSANFTVFAFYSNVIQLLVVFGLDSQAIHALTCRRVL
jgi:hypothetical protein